MGHLLFIILHVIALLFGMVWLIVTIPLHLIYGAVHHRHTPSDANRADHDDAPQARCPDCRELVRADAKKCKHCGSVLTPVEPSPPSPRPFPSDFSRSELLKFGALLAALALAILVFGR